jgi:hypothetical protein
MNDLEYHQAGSFIGGIQRCLNCAAPLAHEKKDAFEPMSFVRSEWFKNEQSAGFLLSPAEDYIKETTCDGSLKASRLCGVRSESPPSKGLL